MTKQDSRNITRVRYSDWVKNWAGVTATSTNAWCNQRAADEVEDSGGSYLGVPIDGDELAMLLRVQRDRLAAKESTS